MGNNDRTHAWDVTMERQKVQGPKHHLEMESYHYSEKKITRFPIFNLLLPNSQALL